MEAQPNTDNLAAIDEIVGQGWIELRAGNLEAAAQRFQNVLGQDGQHLDALYGMGLVHRNQGDDAAAREKWETAQSITRRFLENHEQSDASFERTYMIQVMLRQRVAEIS